MSRHPGWRCLVASTLALVGRALLLSSCGALRGPRYVERVTIANPYEYDVSADVSDGRSGWQPLGTVPRESETVVEDVIDTGRVWVFRFRYHDQAEEEVTVTRSLFVEGGWQVQVPKRLIERLRASGEPPSYRSGCRPPARVVILAPGGPCEPETGD